MHNNTNQPIGVSNSIGFQPRIGLRLRDVVGLKKKVLNLHS
jgi:hypothetical protein